IEIIRVAKQKGIKLFMDDEKLKYQIDKHQVVEPALLEQIRKYKQDIQSLLAGTYKKQHSVITRTPRQFGERVPLSFSQERLWFIDQLEGSVHYHLPWVMRLKGKLNIEALTYSFQEIVKRHEILRTVVKEEDGKAYQEVLDWSDWNLPVAEKSSL